MSDFAALLIAVGIFLLGLCIDNGLTNLARAFAAKEKP
jgi:hypothetical protein